MVSTASAGIIPNGGPFQLSEGIIHPFSSGFASTPISKFLLFTQPLSDNTPAPTNLEFHQGNFWVNYTWEAGSGIITDSFNVSHNDLWNNSTSLTYLNSSVEHHGWSNITVWAYNNSEGLSLENISNATQVENNIPVMNPIGNQEVVEGELLQFNVTASDADGDTLTFGTDASNGSFDPGSGAYSWQTAIGDVGEYTWTFNASDNYGGNDSITIMVNISKAPPVLTSMDIEPNSTSLLAGENIVFTAYPRDQYGELFITSISWSSSNTTVGTVDESGNFSALAAGITTITAESGLISATAEVTVTTPSLNVVSNLTNVTAGIPTSAAFNVTRIDTGEAVDNATVTLAGAAEGTGTTSPDGTAELIVNATSTGEIIVTAGKEGFNNGQTTIISEAAPIPSLNVIANLSNVTAGIPTSVTFNVTRIDTGEALDNATVTLAGAAEGTETTSPDGTAEIIVNATSTGEIIVTAGKEGFNNGETTLNAVAAPVPSLNVVSNQTNLTAGIPTSVAFNVTRIDTGEAVDNATVTLAGAAEGTGTTSPDGTAELIVNATSTGEIIVTAGKEGFNNGETIIISEAAPIPSLKITAFPANVTAGVPTNVTFNVTRMDNDEVVEGAGIALSGPGVSSNGTSNSTGISIITVNSTSAGIITATASFEGFINGTANITATAAPIVQPTIAPTILPTIAPTILPTIAPTILPTIAPTILPTIPPVTPILTTITVSPQTATLALGETQAFTATTKDQNGNLINAVITWSSSNITVGTIDASGKFTAKSPGTVMVNATNGLIKGTALVTVTKPKLPPSSNPNGTYKGKEGIPVPFDGSKSFDPDGSIVSYFWDFGDGSNGTGVNPTHTYIHSGNYPVILKVTDNDGLNATNSTSAIIEEQVIKIISPTNGENFETSSVEVRGTALSSVSSVQVRVGKGSWENASGNKSWNSTVSLSEGENTISARANYKKAGNSEETSIIVTYAPPHSPDTGGTGNTYIGTSGGGGGGNSGENVYNIELIEKYDLEIFRNKTTSYWFKHLKNPIMYINITGNTNLGLITTSTEILKDTSTFVNNPPEGLVYKNINIWVGTSGIATPRNIKEASIKFRVDNTWMSSNGVKGSDIALVKWNGTAWIALETMELSKDDAYTFFQGKTNAFSPFAITTNVAGAKSSLIFTDQEVPIESGGMILGSDGMPIQPARTANVAQTESSGTSPWSIILIIFVVGIIVLVYYVRIKK